MVQRETTFIRKYSNLGLGSNRKRIRSRCPISFKACWDAFHPYRLLWPRKIMDFKERFYLILAGIFIASLVSCNLIFQKFLRWIFQRFFFYKSNYKWLIIFFFFIIIFLLNCTPATYIFLRPHDNKAHPVCRLLLKKKQIPIQWSRHDFFYLLSLPLQLHSI